MGVEVGCNDLGVVQRNRDPQHRGMAGDRSPVGDGFSSVLTYADAAHDPIFKSVLNSFSGNSVVIVLAQMPGQPSGDAAGRDGLWQGSPLVSHYAAALAVIRCSPAPAVHARR